ncbi:SIMPL domain-containing protein [Aquimarina sediminis]|uniref:SIMPL domain-containing protein n=1 Tax=Aquimarina sediminis TaxID=2070536 RepID=UPI000CA01FC4|nr:SIMPL domain-containing protein [Aquimarina sediminis]
MKKIILIIFICTASLFGQGQNSTITVTGEYSREIDIEKYIIYVDFREALARKPQNSEQKKIPQLKSEFKEKLSKVGVDFGKFKKHDLYEVTGTAYGTSSYYYYATKSLDEVKKILIQKIEGVSAWAEIMAKEITNKDMAMLNKIAIDDARDKAMQMASNINKKIGTIKEIEDINHKEFGYYNAGRPYELHKHYVKVTFALE